MQRFYIADFEKAESFELKDPQSVHQLVKVLRVRE
jgi:predicted Ser/Thr protein kinase